MSGIPVDICLDTGIGDMSNSKIPIQYTDFWYFCYMIPIAGLKRYFKSKLLCLYIITFRTKKTKFIITEGRFYYFNVV